MWSVNPVFFYYIISVLQTVFSHKYRCMSVWRMVPFAGYAGHQCSSWAAQGTEFHPLAEWSCWNHHIIPSSIVPVSHSGLGTWHWRATLRENNVLRTDGLALAVQCTLSTSPTVDWQLCPGKLAYYLARGTLPSIDNQAPRQQNDHKWISAVNIQGLIPSHLGWLEAWSLYC